MKNKSKTGGKNLNRGRRKWFHKGEFIGLDIQSVIMTVLTMLTIAVTVVMGLLIYNRFAFFTKQILTKYKAWFCTTMKENLWHQNQFLQRKRT